MSANPRALDEPDLERRFGGLRRLYGDVGYQRLRAAHVAVIGVGGVGSWAVEALARSGVAALTLIDLDHVAESNINRQVQATGRTLGQAKVLALAERIGDIHPGCRVQAVDEFVEGPGTASPGNWPQVLPSGVDVVIDACDQRQAKLVMAAWALREKRALVIVGAAGGKRQGHRIEVADLAETTHDPLLAGLRQRLRRDHGAPRQGRIGLRCVFTRENVALPANEGAQGDSCGIDSAPTDGSLNCHGYGSTVIVTAAFGLAAAGQAIEALIERGAGASAENREQMLL